MKRFDGLFKVIYGRSNLKSLKSWYLRIDLII